MLHRKVFSCLNKPLLTSLVDIAGRQGQGKGTKRGLDDDTVEDDIVADVKIRLPANLKKQLIADWENITRKQMIVPLDTTSGHPTATVTKILSEYTASKASSITDDIISTASI